MKTYKISWPCNCFGDTYHQIIEAKNYKEAIHYANLLCGHHPDVKIEEKT